MSRIPLLGGAYRDRSAIASTQQTVNLYAEQNTNQQAPAPFTYYQTPGSTLFATPPVPAKCRCSYRTTLGTAFAVIGVNIYFVSPNGAMILVGTIADRPSQVSISDNGLVAVIVDGSSEGWVINLADNSFGSIADPSFYGADFAIFQDTFFIFNRPATNQFYISLSMVDYAMLTNSGISDGTIVGGSLYTDGTYDNVALTGGSGTGATANITIAAGAIDTVDIIDPGINYLLSDVLSANVADIGGTGSGFTYTITTLTNAFDPLDIAAKSGSADPIVGIATVHKELWLIGALTTEVWIGTGAADFYFQINQGMYIDHGCSARYSVASQDVVVFWLMEDRQGQFQIMQGAAGTVVNIATSYLTDQLSRYSVTNDAVGGVWAQNNHAFYVLIFPTENVTWVFDLTTNEWFSWTWTDNNGDLNRHRANTFMFFNGANMIGDWETGNIYVLDSNVYQDFGGPITRIKTFLHMVGNDFEQVHYKYFDADIQCATTDIDDPNLAPQIFLSWSDDRGKTYGNPVGQSFGLQGENETTITWRRLGKARDRLFKLQWSEPLNTSLLGGFAEPVNLGN